MRKVLQRERVRLSQGLSPRTLSPGSCHTQALEGKEPRRHIRVGGYRVFLKKTSTEGCLCATRYEVDWEVVFEDVKELKVQGKKD